MDYATMGMLEVSKLPGVHDLTPLSVRAKFAQALIAEAKGLREEAGRLLAEAIAKLS